MPQDADRALAALADAVESAQQHLEQLRVRIGVLQAQRAAGSDYAQVVTQESRPLVVERLTEVLEELATAGAAFRRAEARVLHTGGLSQEAIGALFGVTRQRVSALLKGL